MRILMVGAGATGGFYGGMLLQAGRDITFLLREHRAHQIRQHGLQLLPFRAEPLTLRPRVLTAAELRAHPETFDLIIISTKSYQLAGAMEDLAPAVGPATMLLPILNGMRQLDMLSERFGTERVLGGSVRIVSDLDEQGRVLVMATLDDFSYGELSRQRSDRICAVDTALQNAGFSATLEPDIRDALWQKWWMLAAMGSICLLGRGNIGQIARAPHGSHLQRNVVEECASVATANGFPPTPQSMQQVLQRFTNPESSLTSSMYRDMLKGAPVEADHILGDLLNRTNGLPTPLITAAYVQLKVYEAARAQQ